MAGKLGRYQVTPSFTSWKGISSANHIGSIFRANVQKASELMVQVLANYKGKTLESFLAKFPTKNFETKDDYTWDIVGSHRRNIPLIEARDMNGNVISSGMAGVNGEPFYLVFAEDYFADGEVLAGELNEVYPIRIRKEAIMEGSNAKYEVELMGGILDGMPAEELAAGKKFSVEYAPVEDGLSREVGDLRFASNAEMRNEFSTIRIKHKADGDMIDRKVAVGIPVIGKDGKKTIVNKWMHYVDMEMEIQFSEAKNKILAFGRSNKNANGEYLNIGKSGKVIKMGAGLIEKIISKLIVGQLAA